MKKSYSELTVSPLEVSMQGSLLASSVVRSASVNSDGQEVGVAYTLSTPDGIDENTGKTFSHEWESGTN